MDASPFDRKSELETFGDEAIVAELGQAKIYFVVDPWNEFLPSL